MTDKDRKTEPPFGLDMDFGEALERFIATRPQEVVDSVERAKQKRPPEDDAPRRPARRQRDESSSGRNRKPNEDG
ncbi:MAG: hypothetical protein WAP03_26840 [Methylorubrum rhodinum]|uniref:hypothetical protein n=1 Tax=Methylorubrum rhodinum TaxID=29428 RepID=UPI003BB09AC3